MGAESPAWTIERGVNFSKSVRLRPRLFTQPINLSDWQFWSQIRTTPGAALIESLTCETYDDILTVSLTNEQTLALPLGPNNTPLNARVDVIAERPNGKRMCLVETRVTIQGLITEVPE